MSRSLLVRFVVAGLVSLLAAATLLFFQERAAARDRADESARSAAATVADNLDREFQSWRTELLVASNNPALREWFAPGADQAQLREEIDRALLQLNALNPDLIDEACYIAATGPELGRQTSGAAAAVSDLSPDESGNPFFSATLALPEGGVHQNAPYISPDSNRWVISNSTPVVVAGQKVAMLHFESNLDAIRVLLRAAASDGAVLRVVDSRTSQVIADSRSTSKILDQPLAKTSAKPFPSGWSSASTDLATPSGDDNHWRVEVAVEPAPAINNAMLVRFGLLVLLALVALFFLARRSAREIVAPLRRIGEVAHGIAEGDRSRHVELSEFTEISQVALAINTMVDGLAEQDVQLAHAHEEREGQLQASVEQQRLAEVALREHAQSAIHETAGSVSAELRQLSDQVDVVRQGAATIDERVTATDAVTQDVIEQARRADEVVAELQASLREVDGMTRLIAGVADQTKLLALNATIEAARAGDAGRGFSVVADEVKELAMATARSTDQISATIAKLNDHSNAVGAAITEMGAGIGQVGEAASVLREVAEQQFAVVGALNAQVEETRARVDSMADLT